MRFLLSILIWIFLVGGLWAYTLQRDASLPKGPAPVAEREVLSGEYVLEITPGFSIDKDPFALSLDDDPQPNGLEIRLNGQVLTVGSGEISRGKVIRITEGLTPTVGFNEFYVQASPPISETNLDHGLRIRFLDRGTPVIDHTVWGTRGALVAGTVSFSLTAHKEENHDH